MSDVVMVNAFPSTSVWKCCPYNGLATQSTLHEEECNAVPIPTWGQTFIANGMLINPVPPIGTQKTVTKYTWMLRKHGCSAVLQFSGIK
jgi:hypothetical protein